MARICLITPHHISFQPRTLREADALCEAGHEVRVVCRQTDSTLTEYDRELMRTRTFRLQTIDLQRNGHNRRGWLIESLRAKTYRKLFDVGLRAGSIGLRSYVKGFDQLLELARCEPADWFIAHTQAALPIAAAAAKHWKAKLGFDCEDLLAGNGTDPADVVDLIQQTYLPQCDYVSVPSRCMGRRLSDTYCFVSPSILYNVLPVYLAQGLISPNERATKSTLRLHWFGQTIGEGRGVEEAVAALGMLASEPIELHLRGRLNAEFRSKLETIARRHGALDKLCFQPTVPPQDVLRTMDQFDVGLALERVNHGNYSLAATNKLFSYLLAGLAVAATDTPGQREVIQQVPSAGFLYDSGNPAALADGLRRWLANRNDLRATQQAAWDVARRRFCWDLEKENLLRLLEPSRSTPLAQTA